MNQLALTNIDRLSYPTCRDCGAPMRLFGIEAHPTVDRTDLRTYVCSRCDEVQTENVPLLLN
jgi:RNA polymerase-binding transcription factor DksA